MRNLNQQIKDGYLMGFIKVDNSIDFYLMPVAYWILNYNKYDPNYDPRLWDIPFRNHLYIISDHEVPAYLDCICEFKLSMTDLKYLYSKDKSINFYLFIDFDSKLYMNNYLYTELENYLPDSSWMGEFKNPIDNVPDKVLKQIIANP